MNEVIFLVEEAPEGGYSARAIGETAIFTEADSLEELREAVRDAVRCHFDEDDRPALIRLHFREGGDRPRVKLPRDLSGQHLAQALARLGYEVTRQTL